MVAKQCTYVPARGDIVWLVLDPARGHEQKGRRPALVLSSKVYNRRSELMLAAPVTSVRKGYPFESHIDSKAFVGTVLADQIRCVDWQARKAKKVTSVSPAILHDVQEKLRLLLFQDA